MHTKFQVAGFQNNNLTGQGDLAVSCGRFQANATHFLILYTTEINLYPWYEL